MPFQRCGRFFEVSRSGYYDFVNRKNKPCKDDELIKHIQYCQKSNGNTYGYRRVWLWLEGERYSQKSENDPANYEEIWAIVRNSSTQKMGSDG